MNARREDPAADDTDEISLIGIGALSQATGVPIETLRTWERRYGFPTPAGRGDAKHRRYPLETVARLRLVLRALELGHKPSLVLGASSATLRALLALEDREPVSPPQPERNLSLETRGDESSFRSTCLHAAGHLDGEALLRELDRAWSEVGALTFLEHYLAPFLTALGEAWRSGKLGVANEHFASEHVREFLSAHWRSLSARARGPRIVCAGLNGERHVLGLHMAATAVSLAGARVTFLGADTPVADVAEAVAQQRATAVLLSSAAGTDPGRRDHAVAELYAAIPREVSILVGGAGFVEPPPGVVSLGRLPDLARWVEFGTPPLDRA